MSRYADRNGRPDFMMPVMDASPDTLARAADEYEYAYALYRGEPNRAAAMRLCNPNLPR